MAKNSPDVLLSLTKKQAQFIVENCDANITFALSQLQNTDNMKVAKKLVDKMESFKELKKLVTAELEDL